MYQDLDTDFCPLEFLPRFLFTCLHALFNLHTFYKLEDSSGICFPEGAGFRGICTSIRIRVVKVGQGSILKTILFRKAYTFVGGSLFYQMLTLNELVSRVACCPGFCLIVSIGDHISFCSNLICCFN